jgi:hypothetical protein
MEPLELRVELVVNNFCILNYRVGLTIFISKNEEIVWTILWKMEIKDKEPLC